MTGDPARMAAGLMYTTGPRNSALAGCRRSLRALETAVREVRRYHEKSRHTEQSGTVVCVICLEVWPCPTIKILERSGL